MKFIEVLLFVTAWCVTAGAANSTGKLTSKNNIQKKTILTIIDIPELCKRSEFRILNQAELDQIGGCQQLVGDLVFDNFSDSLIRMNVLTHIEGSIHVLRSPSLLRLEAQSLEVVTESIQMDRLQSLAMINFPLLTYVKDLDLKVLPLLTFMDLGKVQNIRRLVLSDTALTSVSVANASNMTDFDINNNRFMESIEIGVQDVSGTLHISGNGRNINVDLSQLRVANNITVNNVEALKFDSLEDVSGSVSILENTFSSLSLPKLSRVGGLIRLADNNIVTSVEVNALTDIGGGLLIVNNTNLNNINFFPSLTVIGGGLDIEGDVQQTSWPELRFIKGAANLISTSNDFDCSEWLNSEVNDAMRGGEINCQARGTVQTRESPAANRTDSSLSGLSSGSDSNSGSSAQRDSESSALIIQGKFWPIVFACLICVAYF